MYNSLITSFLCQYFYKLILAIFVIYSEASEPGQHWFVLLKVEQGQFELFDSLGGDSKFLLQTLPYSGECTFNATPVQLAESTSCGEFCLYYIIQRLHNLDLDFDNFINDFFCAIPEVNELRVSAFINKQCP